MINLAWTIYTSFLVAILLICLPFKRLNHIRLIALCGAGVNLIISFLGAMTHPGGGQLVEFTKVLWIKSLGIEYYLAADGISVVLVVLTSIASVAGILFSWNINHRVNEYFAFYFLLIGSVYGVFLSYDLFLLFVFYELAIIPKYFLIAIWGSTNREYGAMKLVIYSFAGSALVLIGIVAVYIYAGGKTTNLILLLQKTLIPKDIQVWLFLLVFIGFAILAGIFPFHTWAPTGHVAAPTAASMLLAGVIMKLGAYGCLRVALLLFPDGAYYWQLPISMLAIAGIIVGGAVALTQRDFKFVIGYSSVSHMGFVLLGLMTFNKIGVTGAVFQMFSHGVIAGLLFAVVGRMVYDRTHTRELFELRHLALNKSIPYAALTFAVAGFASMGLPGFSGFIAELQVIIGSWKAFPLAAIFAGVGIIIGAAYILRAMQLAFYSERLEDYKAQIPGFEPISIQEKVGSAILILSTLLAGLFPNLLLNLILPALDAPIFNNLWKGGVGL
ncbi:MAG: complex I subunit 4 family protein [Limisphaerales bacterium]|jgi:NADH-quinone oxidoreductase subunit M